MARLLVHGFVFACIATFALSQNLSWSELRRLYNTHVTSAQRYERDLLGSYGRLSAFAGMSRQIRHAGVVVSTADGGRWLIHKGKKFSRGSRARTVVTRASYMSSNWSARGPRKSIWQSTVGDYVRAGGTNYNLLDDNCLDAADAMMFLN